MHDGKKNGLSLLRHVENTHPTLEGKILSTQRARSTRKKKRFFIKSHMLILALAGIDG